MWVWQVGGADGDELEDFEVASILQTHTADVKFVAWHPNGDVGLLLFTCSSLLSDRIQMLVSGGYDGTLA